MHLVSMIPKAYLEIKRHLKFIFFFGLVFLTVLRSGVNAQENTLDSIRAELNRTPQLSEARFKKAMNLATYYREKRPTLDIVIDGFEKDYLRHGTEALAWAEKEGTPLQLAQARRFKVDYILYYSYNIDDSNFDFLTLGQQMINDGVFFSKEDEYYVYRKLTDIFIERQFYKEYLTLVPKKFAMARELSKPYSEPFREYAEIGTIYYRQKDYKTAREYYRRTLDSLKGEKENLFKASIINNIALSFSKQGLKDSAVYYYQKSLKCINSGPSERYDYKTDQYDEHIKNVIKANIAYLEVNDGNYDEAIVAIKKELYTGKREDEVTTTVQAYNKLGELFYLKKQYPIALIYLDSALHVMKVSMHDNELIANQRHRAKILLVTGKQDKAEELFSKAQGFEDSINLIKSEKQIKVASVLYETQAKEKQLQTQRLSLAKQSEEILKKEKANIVYSIIVFILGGSLLIFLWFNKKIKSKKEEIEAQKKLVDDSLKEKEILLKEIHHRVKNNLQVVSSLLIKQGVVSNNEEVKKLMEDGQNRIKSMAMVHQLLYQTEDHRNLNLKEYTKFLVSSISSSNHFQGMDISTEIKMDDIYVHIDIAVPYGLILNELLSNSFEHGFSYGDSGRITILLVNEDRNKLKLIISDTGKGIPEDIEQQMKNSMGINLVKGLAWQLRGSLGYKKTANGSKFEVTFMNNLNDLT